MNATPGWPVVDDHAADRTGYLIDDLAGVWVVLIVHDHTRGEGARQLEQRGSKINSVVVFGDQGHRSETFLEKAAADPQGTDGYPKDGRVYRPARLSAGHRPDDFGTRVDQLGKATVEGICYPLREHHWTWLRGDEGVTDEVGSTTSTRGEEQTRLGAELPGAESERAYESCGDRRHVAGCAAVTMTGLTVAISA